MFSLPSAESGFCSGLFIFVFCSLRFFPSKSGFKLFTLRTPFRSSCSRSVNKTIDFETAISASESFHLACQYTSARMDSAENEQWAAALRAQEACLSQQQEFQTTMAGQMGQLSTQVRDLLEILQGSATPTVKVEAPATTTVPTSSLVGTGAILGRTWKSSGLGDEPVCDNAIRFRSLAAESGWNSKALYDTFTRGLAVPIQELLLPITLPPTLDGLISRDVGGAAAMLSCTGPPAAGPRPARLLGSPGGADAAGQGG